MAFLEKILQRLESGHSLTSQEVAQLFQQIFIGEEISDQVLTRILSLWADKGETGEELRAAASFMHDQAILIHGGPDVVDTCGTGGDGLGTFNISTAAAFVAAGAGVRVAKHGNRSATSRSGSADFLAALGVRLDLTPEEETRCLATHGLCFLYAPSHHPLMKRVAGARQALGKKTIFNLLGPLLNPAGACVHLLGVYAREKHRALAESFIGDQHRLWLVTSHDGLDEITTTDVTYVTEVRGDKRREFIFDPASLGIPRARLADLAGGTVEENAARLGHILAGQESRLAECVVLNAAAAIALALDIPISEAFAKARMSLQSGRAKDRLARLVNF